MKEFLSMKMGKKEKVQDFNQSFTTLLSNFSVVTKLAEEYLVEVTILQHYIPL